MRVPTAKQLPSGNWRCQVRVEGVPLSFTAATPEEAVAQAMAAKAGMKQEKAERRKMLTLKQAAETYISDRSNVLSPATVRGYKTIMRNRFPGLWGKNIWTMEKADIQKAVNQDAKKIGAKTLKNSCDFVLSVLGSYDIEIHKIRLGQITTEERAYLEPEQIITLVSAVAGTWMELPTMLAVWLGMRRSEIWGLKWGSVDFAKKKIKIEAAMVPDEHHKFVEKKETKNRSSRRTVDCPDYIIKLLTELEPDPQKRTGLVIKYNPERFRKHFKRTCDGLGFHGIGLHSLRHTNASVMMTLGVADRVAMARGGWATEGTMKKIYQHVLTAAQEDADASINRYFTVLLNKGELEDVDAAGETPAQLGAKEEATPEKVNVGGGGITVA